MAELNNPTPPPGDHLLEDLAQLTGLFNPEIIWQQEEELDRLETLGSSDKPANPAPTDPDER